jgi:hypothetical protein
MYLQKVISRKICVKNLFFGGILKINDDSRIWVQDPDPDPLVRGMDLAWTPKCHGSGTLNRSMNEIILSITV